MKTAFPIVDDAGALLGLVTLPIATSIPEQKRNVVIVDDIMVARDDLIVMDLNKNAYEALNEMARKKMNMVFICNINGNIEGLITKTDILSIAAERQKYFQALKRK